MLAKPSGPCVIANRIFCCKADVNSACVSVVGGADVSHMPAPLLGAITAGAIRPCASLRKTRMSLAAELPANLENDSMTLTSRPLRDRILANAFLCSRAWPFSCRLRLLISCRCRPMTRLSDSIAAAAACAMRSFCWVDRERTRCRVATREPARDGTCSLPDCASLSSAPADRLHTDSRRSSRSDTRCSSPKSTAETEHRREGMVRKGTPRCGGGETLGGDDDREGAREPTREPTRELARDTLRDRPPREPTADPSSDAAGSATRGTSATTSLAGSIELRNLDEPWRSLCSRAVPRIESFRPRDSGVLPLLATPTPEPADVWPGELEASTKWPDSLVTGVGEASDEVSLLALCGRDSSGRRNRRPLVVSFWSLLASAAAEMAARISNDDDVEVTDESESEPDASPSPEPDDMTECECERR